MSLKPSQQNVLVATIGRPHGVRGLVHLYPATETPEAVEELGILHDEQGASWQVRWKAPGIAELLTVEGIPLTDRTAAEKLVNRRLYAMREALPDAGDDNFYHVDLIGMEAVSDTGDVLGRVSIVHDYGAGTSLELDCGVIVPFTKRCVPDIDLATRRLVVNVPDNIEVEGNLDGEVQVRS